ncbi:hypothetical protein KSZ_53660 [Dictyobacter formicarum]|uniref:Uncharacterized protein n=1 Tax=Dictyobacter formicarum TaxID=2778368 RepID=A0ABQ3VNJ0_9CHLR|nr:hypothetical protein KSZ_53660 [Dictyobacter formicarum]
MELSRILLRKSNNKGGIIGSGLAPDWFLHLHLPQTGDARQQTPSSDAPVPKMTIPYVRDGPLLGTSWSEM